MARFAVYDSNAVEFIFAGIPIKEGRPKDGFLTVTPESGNYGRVQDTNSLVTRYKTNNRVYTVEVSLHQSSIHHAQLQAIFGADSLAVDGSGVSSALIKDLNGSTLITFPHIWVEKQPDLTWAEEVQVWTWVLTAVSDGHLVVVGGN
jgi:hypothetical protein